MTSPKKANIFALALIIYTIVIQIVLSITLIKFNSDIEKVYLIFIVIQDLIILLIPILFYCLISRTRLSAIIPHERLSLKNIVYIILLTILVSPLIIVVSSVTAIFCPTDVNNEILYFIDELPMSLCVLALAIMPAVFEELAFRGVILSNYKSVSLFKAAIVSGLFFGLFHMDFYQMGYAILAGVFFSAIVRYTNSIYSSMLSHFLINGVQVVFSKLLLMTKNYYSISENELEELMTQTSSTADIYSSIISGIFFTVISTALLVFTFKKFMEYNKNNKLDYELSISYNNSDEFEIDIDNLNNSKCKFIDMYFIAYVVISIILTVVLTILS